MSTILLILLIIISLAVTFRISEFQSEIINPTPLKYPVIIYLSDFKQFNLLKSDKYLCLNKSAATHLSKSHLSHNGNWKINTAAVFFLK
ncbi:MAG: hypothetical protein ACYCZ2_15885 [Lutibacter sp.]